MAAPIPLYFSRAAGGAGNLGDLLGPVIVAAFTARTIGWRPSRWPGRRLVSIGTVAQWLRFGTVDLWGTGAEGVRGDAAALPRGFRRPPLTRLLPHALRGPYSAALLEGAGFGRPRAYGDPAMLLPLLWPFPAPEKRWELGVVLHLSEVPARRPGGAPDPGYARYAVPEALRGAVRLIDPFVAADAAAIQAKVAEILACRRILSTGLHPLIIAEAYGVPCAQFDLHEGPSGRVAVDAAAPLDHRLRDFAAGMGRGDALVVRQPRERATDWEAAMGLIDAAWAPIRFDPAPLLESFPARWGEAAIAHLPPDLRTLQARLACWAAARLGPLTAR
jgi:pyruvyltransferase